METTDTPRGQGRAYVGTSGFSYPGWAPAFYRAGTHGPTLLTGYAARLAAVELNNTFYQHPSMKRVEAWLAATPPAFRFMVKAQKGGSMRALRHDPAATVPWLTAPYRWFGERLGSVLLRVPEPVTRDDDALGQLLRIWPKPMPLTLEFQHPSWEDDVVHGLLREHGAILCATDLDSRHLPPDLRVTGPFLYVRLRRTTYGDTDLDAWAQRIAPFLRDGLDAYVFFRHDEDGRSALNAERLAALLQQIALSDP